VLGRDIRVVITAVCTMLEDRNILVQRGALELLVVNFPIKLKLVSLLYFVFGFIFVIIEMCINSLFPSTFFYYQKRVFDQSHLCTLTESAITVVLRKDMSLNRRLYAWLLGK